MTPLAHLKEFSALLAQDINQVQAAGGNISLKTSDRLWIKASGKWLADAVLEEIFIDVPLAGASATLSSPLKPSIETSMHLALSAKIVVHTHALNILSYAVQTDGEVILKKLLAAFSPFWIPYAQPGESLTSAIKKSAPADAQILLLQNHGIIITGASCQEVFKRYQQVSKSH
jgi:rhamnose utilization protein RhaD (predicted bifunctional aldolase and dehydrogenase)